MTSSKLYLSTSDAARLLGLTASAVRLMLRRGELVAAASTESGIQLLDRRDVERLVARRAERRDGGRR